MKSPFSAAFLLRVVVVTAALLLIGMNGVLAQEAFDVRDHPLYLLASYYDAINRRDYARAYNYWNGSPPQGATLEQFTQGFADT